MTDGRPRPDPREAAGPDARQSARAEAIGDLIAGVLHRARAFEAQLEASRRELQELTDALAVRIRAEADQLVEALQQRADAPEPGVAPPATGSVAAPRPSPPVEPRPPAVVGGEPAPLPTAVAAEEIEAALDVLPEVAVDREPARVVRRPTGGQVSRARLAALSMSLRGIPRAGTAEYLGVRFDLTDADADAVLDEIYGP